VSLHVICVLTRMFQLRVVVLLLDQVNIKSLQFSLASRYTQTCKRRE
jgi:hypothetical protein